MSPDLKDQLERIAVWHHLQGVATKAPSWHHVAAADIRAAITACEDAEKNAVIRDKKQSERRFAAVPAAPSAFGSL